MLTLILHPSFFFLFFWSFFFPSSLARGNLATVVIDERLYIIGGLLKSPSSDWEATSVCEVYDISTQTSSFVAHLSTKKEALGAFFTTL